MGKDEIDKNMNKMKIIDLKIENSILVKKLETKDS
jgi:hypothetical protein